MLLWNKYSAVTSAAQTSQQKIIKKKANTKRFTSVPQTEHTYYKPASLVGVYRAAAVAQMCLAQNKAGV